MSVRRLSILALVAPLLVLVLAQSAATAPPPAPPDPTCSPGPSDCAAWHNTTVVVTWSPAPTEVRASGCGPTTIRGDTDGTPVSCTWSNGDGLRTTTTIVRKDSTAPSVTADADRPPDANGWYNHKLDIRFTGSDAMSGIASCTKTIGYSGPDSTNAVLSGTCRDKAANTSAPAQFVLKYDATAPRLWRVRTELASGGVVLSWKASNDPRSFDVVRKPGLRTASPSTLYQGRKRTFEDRHVEAGVKYSYTVTAYDQAGNATVKIVIVEPGALAAEETPAAPKAKSAPSEPALLAPANGARLTLAPHLTWRAVPSATYYNVQLFRNGHKVLSAWPRRTMLRLQTSWKYGGHKYALTPGRYRWYVWPGFGRRSAHRYGKLVGSRRFVVTR